MSITWRIRGRDYDLAAKGMIMGVLNVTPDSFSDGGSYLNVQSAVTHALAMLDEGADILDIGGESTRPGADVVEEAEELRRVIPVIERLRGQTQALISVDTMKAEVARAALAAGADIINDVNGLRDPDMLKAVAASDAGVVVMHMQGVPRTMQASPVYKDVVREVAAFFQERLITLAEAGIEPERVAIDPGFGFGKSLEHNLALLSGLTELDRSGRPLVVGVSRKSMIATLLGEKAMAKRHWPTVALTAWMREAGAHVVRVHEVRPNAEAMRMVEAIVG